MKYFEHLELNKEELVAQLDKLLAKYKVQTVGKGYIDCIVMKENLVHFIKEISSLGIIITEVSWWCYVDPTNVESTKCPHGMGGPTAEYYEGWFSELENDFFEADEIKVNTILNSYNIDLISSLNMEILNGINNILKIPLKYSPNDFIVGNECVNPGLWLLVPDNWDS
ncbi:hypothetical protein [Cytobacillus sp. IB215316]|uniref:hypothetical protein n=1 Tax=Cytobacillus sp. IB215316 TaxID=3097354 RepID=UPI002A15562C|nr:hypothetical protein [Cytobacillus sp. IB215316]MDX8363443.1 hypothetical protein [Cytobacillus sp. IB215316]